MATTHVHRLWRLQHLTVIMRKNSLWHWDMGLLHAVGLGHVYSRRGLARRHGLVPSASPAACVLLPAATCQAKCPQASVFVKSKPPIPQHWWRKGGEFQSANRPSLDVRSGFAIADSSSSTLGAAWLLWRLTAVPGGRGWPGGSGLCGVPLPPRRALCVCVW